MVNSTPLAVDESSITLINHLLLDSPVAWFLMKEKQKYLKEERVGEKGKEIVLSKKLYAYI